MTSEVKMPVVAWRNAQGDFISGERKSAWLGVSPYHLMADKFKEPLVLQSDALAAIEAARVEARAKALEEAAKECKRIANEKWAAYKGRTNPVYKDSLYNPHTEGMSDGADHCAESIRSLAKEAP